MQDNNLAQQNTLTAEIQIPDSNEENEVIDMSSRKRLFENLDKRFDRLKDAIKPLRKTIKKISEEFGISL